jgi:hypothetical protein
LPEYWRRTPSHLVEIHLDVHHVSSEGKNGRIQLKIIPKIQKFSFNANEPIRAELFSV